MVHPLRPVGTAGRFCPRSVPSSGAGSPNFGSGRHSTAVGAISGSRFARLAVGATRGNVLRLFLAGGLWLAAIGAIVGIPLALLTARALETSLFGVTPWEASIWIGPPLALTLVVTIASYLPARRASRVDPVTVLRTD